MSSLLRRPGASRLARTLLAVWIGAMLAQAFVAAPLVFGAVPEHVPTKDAAADVIGPGFGRIDMLGLAAAGLFAATAWAAARRRRAALGLLLLACAAVDGFYLAPRITARAEPLALHHGLATGLWMTAMVVGLGLLLWPPPSAARA